MKMSTVVPETKATIVHTPGLQSEAAAEVNKKRLELYNEIVWAESLNAGDDYVAAIKTIVEANPSGVKMSLLKLVFPNAGEFRAACERLIKTAKFKTVVSISNSLVLVAVQK